MGILQHKYSISSEVLFQEIGGEAVLLDMNSENYFSLDEIGTQIWLLLQEQDDLQVILQSLFDEYDVDLKQLENDVSKLVTQFVEAGLVTIDA